jgi:hypothetical protein
MHAVYRSRLMALLCAIAGLTAAATLRATADERPPAAPEKPPAADAPAAPATSRPDPKPISETVKKGLEYLAKQQLPNGGWAQGEEAQQMRGSGEPAAVANVGDTCIAALALVRAGNTAKDGPYAKNVAKAVEYVCSQVDKSPKDDLSVTEVKGTRLQGKLGPYIDTFLASLLMAELKGKMPDPKSEQMLVASLDRVIGKMDKHQQKDGTWGNNAGWAPVLAQSIATKGLNRAFQNGVQVNGELLARTETFARNNFKPAGQGTPDSGGGKGAFAMDGAASVPLYSFAANAAAGQDAVNTRNQSEADLKKVAEDKNAPKEERDKAQARLQENQQAVKAQRQATEAVVAKLGDKAFVQGFGSNGGEEFLSYMQISETLLVKGGKEWGDWDKSMAENLGRIQNPDGSWSGHHCITGRTFCTATALLVLMADRAPLPAAPKDAAKK